MKNMLDEKDDLFLKRLRERALQFNEEPDSFVWISIHKNVKRKRTSALIAQTILMILLLSLVIVFPTSEITNKTKQNSFTQNHSACVEESIVEVSEEKSVMRNYSSLGKSKIRSSVSSAMQYEEKLAIEKQSMNNNDARSIFINYITHPISIIFPQWKMNNLNHFTIGQAVISISKEEHEKKKEERAPHLYASINPSLNYKIILPSKTDDVLISKLESEGVFSPKRLGFQIEAGLSKTLNTRWEVFGGISYFHQKNTITYFYQSSTVELVSQFDDQLVLKPKINVSEVLYSMENLGLHGGTFFKLNEGRLKHKVGLNLSYQHGFKKASVSDTYSNKQSEYLFAQLQYRFEFVINNRIDFFLQPAQSQIVWRSEKLNAPFTLSPYRVSFNVGMTYRLK